MFWLWRVLRRFAEDLVRTERGRVGRRQRVRPLRRPRQTEGDFDLLDLDRQRNDGVGRRGHRRLLDRHPGTHVSQRSRRDAAGTAFTVTTWGR